MEALPLDALLTGLLVPFFGTTLGAACVYLMKDSMSMKVEKALLGFAAGVMVAASIWSLLIPSIELGIDKGAWRVLPAAGGFIIGMLFLLLLDRVTPHQHLHDTESEGPRSKLSGRSKLILAITIHNIPEGIAVGIMLAGAMEQGSLITAASAMALSIGIAIQNFPEGAIVALPLKSAGSSKNTAFMYGTLSGAVEPVTAIITILIAAAIAPVFPWLLAFGAGAMMYVVVEELIPQTAEGEHSNIATIGFSLGFVLMMLLDVLLG